MDAPEVVALSLEALNGEQVVVVPGEHNIAVARESVRALLRQLGA